MPGDRVQLTPRDHQLLAWVTRHGQATVDQLARRFFPSRSAAYKRLQSLCDGGFLRHRRVYFAQPGPYTVTAEGAELSQTGLPPGRLIPSRLPHSLAVIELSERLLAEHPGSTWTTERELRQERMRLRRHPDTGRLTVGATGPERIADGVLTLADGGRIAVELELASKTTAVYAALIDSYADSLIAEGMARAWWYVQRAQPRRRLRELLEEKGLDALVEVRPWQP